MILTILHFPFDFNVFKFNDEMYKALGVSYINSLKKWSMNFCNILPTFLMFNNYPLGP